MGFGFDFGSGIFGVMFTLMFILVFGLFIVTIVRSSGKRTITRRDLLGQQLWYPNGRMFRIIITITTRTTPPATMLLFRWTAATG